MILLTAGSGVLISVGASGFRGWHGGLRWQEIPPGQGIKFTLKYRGPGRLVVGPEDKGHSLGPSYDI